MTGRPGPENWNEALRRAASELDPARRETLFLEEREDLRVVACSWDEREVLHTRARGLSISGTSGLAFRSDPEVRDVRELVRSFRGGKRGPAAGKGRAVTYGPSRLEAEEAVRLVDRLVQKTLRHCDRPGAWAAGRWVSFEQEVRIARARRQVVADVRRGSRICLDVGIESSGKRSSATGEIALRPGGQESLEGLAERVAQRAVERLDSATAPVEECPVVFASGVGGILIHEIVGHALEADTVARGVSLLAGQRRAIVPAGIVVADDPRRGRAPWRIDDEGVETRATALLQGGGIAGYLHDRSTAAAYGSEPTGHGRRSSFGEPVRPRMGCTFLGPGTMKPNEVLESVGSGVHVRRMEAASTDTANGTALFRVTDADLINRGRLVHPLDPFHLLVVGAGALSSLSHVGDDVSFDTCIGSCVRDGQPLATSVGAPTFRIGVGKVIQGAVR